MTVVQPDAADRWPLPRPRGALTEHLLARLVRPPAPAGDLVRTARRELADAPGEAILVDDDLQLALAVIAELHYRGLDGVDDRWEWSVDLLAVRALLEEPFERALRDAVSGRIAALGVGAPGRPTDLPATLFALVDAADSPPLSTYLARSATAAQFREFLVHRSLYHLKEADPHTWAIPRLAGAAKAALLEIQADEYGGGRPERMHAALFATALRGAGLDDRNGAYVDGLPAVTLAWANAAHLFGLHRRLRGAAVGHLAALEMTSSLPNARYAAAVRRLRLPDQVAWFFDEHVEADAVHEQIAAHHLVGPLIRAEPALAADVLLGAAVALHADEQVAVHLLTAWAAGRSSLLGPARTIDPATPTARTGAA